MAVKTPSDASIVRGRFPVPWRVEQRRGERSGQIELRDAWGHVITRIEHARTYDKPWPTLEWDNDVIALSALARMFGDRGKV